MKDRVPAAPLGALNLIKGTRTFIQHLAKEDRGEKTTKHYPDEALDICLVCFMPSSVCFFYDFVSRNLLLFLSLGMSK